MDRYPAILLVLLLVCSSSAWSEIYKCTDAQGRMQYTDTPCGEAPTAIKPPATSPSHETHDQRMQRTQKLLNAMEAERSEKRQQAEQAREERERRTRNCNVARDRLRQITQAGRLYRLDEAGNRIVLSDPERAGTTAEARASVEQWCD